MIRKIDTEVLEALLKKHETNAGRMDKFVFWIGAGMDCISPSNLPLGNELVKQILCFTCDEYADKILEVLKDATEEINQFMSADDVMKNAPVATQQIQGYQFANIPRLETIIEFLLRCENHMIPKVKSEDSFLSLITCFREAPPNRNHYILAEAILKGATVITVNYSLLIQEAFQQVAKGAYVLEEQKDYSKTDLVRLFQCNSTETCKGTGGKLYHIHGVLSDGDLGNSLSNVKNPFIGKFNQDLSKLLSGENIFLFLGYSGCDSFDVNRFFIDYARENNPKSSTGVYVSHGSIKENHNGEIQISDKQYILLSAFKDKYILQADLTEIIRETEHIPSSQADFNWKDKIPARGYPKEMQKLLAIDLCAFLGINIEKIIGTEDWLPTCEETRNYSDWYKHHPCLLMAKLQQNEELINYYGRFFVDNEEHYLNEQKFADKAERQLHREHLNSIIPNALNQLTDSIFDLDFSKICEIIIDAQESKLIGWEISAPLHQIVKRLTYKYLECNSDDDFSNYIVQHEPLANSVINALTLVMNSGYKHVIEMNQNHLSLRDLSVLLALFKNDFQTSKELLSLSSYYYCEVSSMDGWIGNLLTRYFLGAHELRQKKDQLMHDELVFIEESFEKINSILGFERHACFAKKISTFRHKYRPT